MTELLLMADLVTLHSSQIFCQSVSGQIFAQTLAQYR